jgi:two-component system, NtrC family, sensor histidine kinase HydH
MDVATFESIKAYVGFGEDQAVVLRDFQPIAQAHLVEIVDDFYAAIDSHPRAREVITGGKEQIERLKRTLIAWLDSLLLGPHDAAYLEAHSRIGRVHVRIGLPQEFMFTAMNRIRVRLLEVIRTSLASDPPRTNAVAEAAHQALDLELAIMLDTYREDLMTKVRATERLATIGQLAASIGHELRNPLGIIDSSVFLVQQRTEKLGIDDEPLKKHFEKIRGQIKHCTRTINGLLDLARDRPPKRKRVPLAPLIELALDQSETRDRLEVDRSIPDGLVVDADPDDVVHVLSNLLGNAAQAQGGKGRVRIEAASVKSGTEIRVRDDGPGVAPEISHRIFDALFTTKARGTGLGLALCRRILYAHGGEIGLEPSERGACFRVWIPERAEDGAPRS